ncbi:UNKNOWN [Stylonychia lemnae]|uniref:Uncharacterized protein n=1 Tax=Stylonychia lemnae TaxID=5949 RepID=A0A078B7G2_STYLE|nr:UNKNOWN [Stylonychia lemnae]|eukprot:CDW89242.1 UNKNOWN [Stylonychia lemnae]
MNKQFQSLSPQSQRLSQHTSSLSPNQEKHQRMFSETSDQQAINNQFYHSHQTSKQIILSQKDQTFGNNSPISEHEQSEYGKRASPEIANNYNNNQQYSSYHRSQQSYNSLQHKQVTSPRQMDKIDILLREIDMKLGEREPKKLLTPGIAVTNDQNLIEQDFVFDNTSPLKSQQDDSLNYMVKSNLRDFYDQTVQFREELRELKYKIVELNKNADQYGVKFHDFQRGLNDYSTQNQQIQEKLVNDYNVYINVQKQLKEFNPQKFNQQRGTAEAL